MSPDQVYIGRSRVQFEILSHVLTGSSGIAFGLQNPAENVLPSGGPVLRIELEDLLDTRQGAIKDPSTRIMRRPGESRSQDRTAWDRL